MFISVSSGVVRRLVGIELAVSSFCGIGYPSNAWIECAGSIASRHLGQWDDLDAGRMPCRAESLEALAAKIAQAIHRRFQKFARIELAPALGCDLAERRGHRQPAVGIDIDLSDTVLDAADDFVDRHAPGLRHLAAEPVESILQRLRH